MALFLNGIFDKTWDGLSKAMDLTWKRNEAISANVANAETPMYRATDVSFGTELSRAFGGETATMKTTSSRHIDPSMSDGTSRLIVDLSSPTKPDGNNVDIDSQMGKLAYNAGRYSQANALMRQHLTIIKNVIRDLGR